MNPAIFYNQTRKQIASAGAEPEQALAAALLADARRGCAEGDNDSCRWLHACAAIYLSLITPEDVDPDDLLSRLLEGLPAVAEETVTAWQEDAGRFVQLMLGIFEKGVDQWLSV